MADFLKIPADEHLLHPSVRGDANLLNVIDNVEYDVLSEYRTDGAIALQGYDMADPTKSEAALKRALKHTIAEVVSHRIRIDNDGTYGLTDLTHGDRSWGFKEDVNRKWPDGWNSRLVSFRIENTPILWAT